MTDETIDERIARTRAFKGRIAILSCACGHEIETDMPIEPFLTLPCQQCGAAKWTRKNVGKAIKQDATVPIEMLEKGERE